MFLRGFNMDRQQIALKLAVEDLELPFKIDTFEDRLILQKSVYLAQAIGVHLGYYYQWYLHGPYCPSLTRDEYAIDGELKKGIDESKGWVLDDVSQQLLKRLKELITGSEEKDRSRKLELLASVHFLITRQQVPDDPLLQTKEITATLKKYNKNFSQQEVEQALRELKEYGLLAGL
jgi:uncharacterized protein YwgA